MLQNPETMKKPKYQFQPTAATVVCSVLSERGCGVRTFNGLDIVSVLTGYSFSAGMPETSVSLRRTRGNARSSLATIYRVQGEVTSCHGNEGHKSQIGIHPGGDARRDCRQILVGFSTKTV